MDIIRRLEPVWLVLLIVGGLNWACIALFDTNVVAEIFGTGTVTDVIYVLVGLAALAQFPRLLEDMHLTSHRARPTGA